MTTGTAAPKKRRRRPLRWIGRVLWPTAFVLLTGAFLLVLPPVQTWLAKRVSASLSKSWGTTLRIDRLEIGLLGSTHLYGVLLLDLTGDTLIAADEIHLLRPTASLSERRFSTRALDLVNAHFNLNTAAGRETSNLTELLDHIAPPDTAASERRPWRIVVRQVNVSKLAFNYHNANYEPLPFGVDVDHVEVFRADLAARELRIDADTITLALDRMALTERSGLQVDHLSAAARISSQGIKLDGVHLVTPRSDIKGDWSMSTDSYADYKDFSTNVRLRGKLDDSFVEFADIALFAPQLEGMDLPVRFSGQVRGTLNDMKGQQVKLHYGTRSSFAGNVELSGLPDLANTFVIADIDHLRLDAEDLANVPLPPFTSKRKLQLPAEVKRLQAVDYTGNYTGFASSFTAYGTLSTAAGTLRSDASYRRDTLTQVISVAGLLSTEGFDIARIFPTSTVGMIACHARIKAEGSTWANTEADINGRVDRLHVNGYDLGGITLNGRLERNLFNGHLTCNDPSLQMRFDGLADLRGPWPMVDFHATVDRFDPNALGLLPGSGFSDLVFSVEAAGELAPDSLNGWVILDNVTFCEDTTDLELGTIALRSTYGDGTPRIILESDAVDLSVEGTIMPTRIVESFWSIFHSVAPALKPPPSNVLAATQDFTFRSTVKDARPLLDRFVPGLHIAHGTTMAGRMNTRRQALALQIEAPAYGYGRVQGQRLSVAMEQNQDILGLHITGHDQRIGDSLSLGSISINGKAYQDVLDLDAGWEASGELSHGDLALRTTALAPDRFLIDLLPSSVQWHEGVWTNPDTAHLALEPQRLHVDSIRLINADQWIRLSGTVAADTSAALGFEFHEVALDNLSPLLDGPAMHGRLNGDGRLHNLLGSPYMISYLCLDSLAIEQYPIGDLRFAAAWNDGNRKVDLNGQLQRGQLQALAFSGTLNPAGEQQLDLLLELDRFDLRFIEPYLPEDIADIQGAVTGDIAITGSLSEPLFNGKVLLEKAGLRIAYLNTFYYFTQQVEIRPDMFMLDNVIVHDEQGNKARVNGTIIHHGLSRWNFDVSGTMERFLVLNTTQDDNDLFYGTAYGTGDINVSGALGNLEIVVDARSEKGTDIHFPLGTSKDVEGIPFVRFIGPGGWNDTLITDVDLSGITLDLRVEVTPDARLELIFDPTVGDVMRGSGRGNLALSVTPSGDLGMRGDIELVEGDYLFTLRKLVNKRFSVEPGGTISWYGDPFNAMINIEALYKLRAALYDVMPVALRTEAYKKRVPVELVMHLTQNLMNPDIGFEVRLPTVDEGVRTQVQSALATTDDLNKQVFSLIMINRFQPSDATGGNTSDMAAGSATTGTELFSNQVSNWLSQLSSEFDLGVNWRAGDNITQDEVELAVSTQVLDDRLLLSTNVGVRYGATGTQQNNLIGDFNAEYIITQDGRIRLKAYSQSNDRNLNQADQAPTTQGVGIGYRRDFD